MDKPLVTAASVGIALLVGYGVGAAAPPRVVVTVNVPAAQGPTAGTPAAAGVRPAPASSAGLVDWAVLTSYEYQPGMAALPDAVKALDGKAATMRGFLLPLYEFDDIHEFVLVANHMSCCFGIPAGLNGQVLVHVKSKRGLPNTNEPIEVNGTFRAREKSDQGYVISIYEIEDATAVIKGY